MKASLQGGSVVGQVNGGHVDNAKGPHDWSPWKTKASSLALRIPSALCPRVDGVVVKPKYKAPVGVNALPGSNQWWDISVPIFTHL